jgi:hypothetical protein
MLYLVPTYQRPAYPQFHSYHLDTSPFGYDGYHYNYDRYEYERLLEIQRQQQLIERQRRLLALRENQRQKRRDAQRVLSILALAEDIYNQYYPDDGDDQELGEDAVQEQRKELEQALVQDSTPVNVQDTASEPVPEKVQETLPTSTKFSIPIDDGSDPVPISESNLAPSDCGKSDSGKSAKSDESFSMIEMLRQKEANPVILN